VLFSHVMASWMMAMGGWGWNAPANTLSHAVTRNRCRKGRRCEWYKKAAAGIEDLFILINK
jgi:hypothetical protein